MNMEDLLSDVGNKADVAVGAASAAGVWISTKLGWWKKQSKGVKVAVAVGGFLAIAITLSLITAPFT